MWNLFEKIINALRPCQESSQSWDQSQPCDQTTPEQEQPEHETVGAAQQDQWENPE
jgi:hypothetical protein